VGRLGALLGAAAGEFTGGQKGYCEHAANQMRMRAFGSTFSQFHGGSAAATARNLNNAGLMIRLTPGLKLQPGDQVYSTTMGYERGKDGKMHTFGHVETVDSHGWRRDESGKKNRFNIDNFQYVFRPDYAYQKLYGNKK